MSHVLQRLIVARQLTNGGPGSGRYPAGSGDQHESSVTDTWKHQTTVTWNADLDKYCKAKGLDKDAVEAKIKRTVTDYVKGAHIEIRVDPDIFEEKIIPDGRLKNQFETKGWTRASESLEEGNRQRVEENVFGLSKDVAPEDHPIYGYLNNPDTGRAPKVEGYGHVILVLNDDVRDRSTFTMGDELAVTDGGTRANMMPSPMNDPDVKSVPITGPAYARVSPIEGRLKSGGFVGYAEAQIHGGVSLKDIKEVRFNFEDDEDWNDPDYETRIAESLKGTGINVVPSPEPDWEGTNLQRLITATKLSNGGPGSGRYPAGSGGQHECSEVTRSGAPSSANPKLRSAMESVEAEIRDQPTENLRVFDKEGNLILEKAGDRTNVGITGEDRQAMFQGYLTHNHPVGTSFSAPDYLTAQHADLSEIRAVTKTNTFTLERPANGWPDWQKDVEPTFNSYKEQNYNALRDKLIDGDISEDAANFQLSNGAWLATAAATGIKYSVEKVHA